MDHETSTSNTVDLTPQTTREHGAPDSGSVRNRDAERAQVGLEGSRSAVSDESVPNQGRPQQSNGVEKRRAVQSTLAGIVANRQDGTPIQDARITVSPVGSGDVRTEAVSGRDGRFQMTVHRAGRYTLRAEADGFRRYTTSRLLITPAEGELYKKVLSADSLPSTVSRRYTSE